MANNCIAHAYACHCHHLILSQWLRISLCCAVPCITHNTRNVIPTAPTASTAIWITCGAPFLLGNNRKMATSRRQNITNATVFIIRWIMPFDFDYIKRVISHVHTTKYVWSSSCASSSLVILLFSCAAHYPTGLTTDGFSLSRCGCWFAIIQTIRRHSFWCVHLSRLRWRP